jgi:hypothetical protein
MKKIVLSVLYFGILAGLGVVLGCYIHATRVNQTTLMSGVAFVREVPFGEYVVGNIETLVFSYEEQMALKRYKEEHKGKIKIDPEVEKRQRELFGEGRGN